ncbi:hypothetical protein ABK905_21330 [Acerihabitans sp. KWT182]|uniref:Uncharacterized protein n=1 Tax=Acerihabitans sp. KWT182 TaxID=3157919 RepID=A0AAU7Q7A7_9GAMM
MRIIFLFPLMAYVITSYANEKTLFFCTTEDGIKLSAKEHHDKLELKINSTAFLSDESINIIKKDFLKRIKVIPDYNVISFHIKGVEYHLGSYKATSTQAEPSGRLFTLSDKKTISEHSCSFGEDVNNFRVWENE